MIRCFDLLLSEPSYGNCRSTQVSVIKYYGRIDMESQRERETGKMYFSAEHVRLSIMRYFVYFFVLFMLKKFSFLSMSLYKTPLFPNKSSKTQSRFELEN